MGIAYRKFDPTEYVIRVKKGKAVVGITIMLSVIVLLKKDNPSPSLTTFPFFTLITYSVGSNFLYAIPILFPPSLSYMIARFYY